MRIISGKYKGRRLSPPSSFRARPTTDFARESLFNILSGRYDFDGMHVLDLFAGTGSIGIEFLSRGAAEVQMVDINRDHISFIKQFIASLNAKGAYILHGNVKDYLKRSKRSYDIVFADPPYDLTWLETIPDLVLNSGVVKPGGLFILEHPKSYSFNLHSNISEHRYYGSVNFSFFVNNN